MSQANHSSRWLDAKLCLLRDRTKVEEAAPIERSILGSQLKIVVREEFRLSSSPQFACIRKTSPRTQRRINLSYCSCHMLNSHRGRGSRLHRRSCSLHAGAADVIAQALLPLRNQGLGLIEALCRWIPNQSCEPWTVLPIFLWSKVILKKVEACML